MSLARCALRLATVEALRPTALLVSDGPRPTIAKKCVFDSRLDPIEDLAVGESRPVVVVYTDDDEGSPGQKVGGPPFKQLVELCFEVSVVASAPSDADPAVFVAGIPETDAELEASLDLLEAQIKFICFYGPTGALWRDLSPLVRSLDKVRLLDDVKSGAMVLVILHVIGPNVASIGEVSETARQIGGGSKHYIVKNHVTGEDTFADFEQDPRFAEMFANMQEATINVPQLIAEGAGAVQREGMGFIAFARDAAKSRITRGYVFDWLAATFRELDRVGLGDLVAPETTS
jgi:hypothetical protein